MSKIESCQNAIAKRYGKVLFALAQENKVLKDVLNDVTYLHQCLLQESLDWNHIIRTPLKVQCQLIAQLAVSLKLRQLTTQFLKVVCRNYRLQSLFFMLEDFMIRCKEGVEGVLETATELSQKEIEHLQSVLKERLHEDISLRQTDKESLLGGVVLRLGTLMIDMSLETQLNNLRHAMRG